MNILAGETKLLSSNEGNQTKKKGVILGAGIGMIAGAALGNIAVGMVVGAALGAIGAFAVAEGGEEDA